MRIIVTINFSNISVSPGFYEFFSFFFSMHARILVFFSFRCYIISSWKRLRAHHNSLKQFIKLKFIGKIFNVTVGFRRLTHNSKNDLPTEKSIKNSEKWRKKKVCENTSHRGLSGRKLQKRLINPQVCLHSDFINNFVKKLRAVLELHR